MRNILPGQAVIIPKDGGPIFKQVQPQKRYCPDIFEYIYFARPDTVMDGISVHQSRENMGYKLAAQIKRVLTPTQLEEIDVVMSIPETSNTIAPCVAVRLDKPYRQGFVKNRYVFRTFIMPGQKARQAGVRRKLNAMHHQFAGKNTLLVDDSIVRGTTCREIISMAKEAGAKDVYFASAAPRIRHPHIYGIDLASPSELIAHRRSVDEIAAHIGAKKVIFQELPDLIDACRQAAPTEHVARETQEFEVGVFNGQYVTPVPDGYFMHLEHIRGESKRMKVIKSAREAVAKGSAGLEEFQIAANGAEVTEDGTIIPSSSAFDDASTINGGDSPIRSISRKRTMDEEIKPRQSQDVAINNLYEEPYDRSAR